MTNKIRIRFTCVFVLFSTACFYRVAAQVNDFGAGFFQNQYLFNPAMSGLHEKQGDIGAGYRKSGNIKDGPQSYFFTGDYAFKNNVGAGVNIFFDRAGFLSTSRMMATYSYHVQLDEIKRLHFGLSLGGILQRLDMNNIYGDPNDPVLYNYNNQRMKFEADFGVAYTDGKLTIQAAAPNLASTFRKENKTIANQQQFFGALSYKTNPSGDDGEWSVEPKIAYMLLKGSRSIGTGGANITYNNLINLFGMYRTNKSVTIGAGLKLSNFAQITTIYKTQSEEFKSYSGGDYEIGLILFLR